METISSAAPTVPKQKKSQTKIIEDLLIEHRKITLRMLFDAGVGYEARSRICEMRKNGWVIDSYTHNKRNGETVQNNAYILVSEPKYESNGQRILV